mmetsp:Transcript_35894/g.81245  ORF Transcript_35894/g.81245 Transcript_35894/m.81245 type:complete len:300 (-) Transcript_35894:439-1338(-)
MRCRGGLHNGGRPTTAVKDRSSSAEAAFPSSTVPSTVQGGGRGGEDGMVVHRREWGCDWPRKWALGMGSGALVLPDLPSPAAFALVALGGGVWRVAAGAAAPMPRGCATLGLFLFLGLPLNGGCIVRCIRGSISTRLLILLLPSLEGARVSVSLRDGCLWSSSALGPLPLCSRQLLTKGATQGGYLLEERLQGAIRLVHLRLEFHIPVVHMAALPAQCRHLLQRTPRLFQEAPVLLTELYIFATQRLHLSERGIDLPEASPKLLHVRSQESVLLAQRLHLIRRSPRGRIPAAARGTAGG